MIPVCDKVRDSEIVLCFTLFGDGNIFNMRLLLSVYYLFVCLFVCFFLNFLIVTVLFYLFLLPYLTGPHLRREKSIVTSPFRRGPFTKLASVVGSFDPDTLLTESFTPPVLVPGTLLLFESRWFFLFLPLYRVYIPDLTTSVRRLCSVLGPVFRRISTVSQT